MMTKKITKNIKKTIKFVLEKKINELKILVKKSPEAL